MAASCTAFIWQGVPASSPGLTRGGDREALWQRGQVPESNHAGARSPVGPWLRAQGGRVSDGCAGAQRRGRCLEGGSAAGELVRRPWRAGAREWSLGGCVPGVSALVCRASCPPARLFSVWLGDLPHGFCGCLLRTLLCSRKAV